MVFEIEFEATLSSHPVASQQCAGMISEDLSFLFVSEVFKCPEFQVCSYMPLK